MELTAADAYEGPDPRLTSSGQHQQKWTFDVMEALRPNDRTPAGKDPLQARLGKVSKLRTIVLVLLNAFSWWRPFSPPAGFYVAVDLGNGVQAVSPALFDLYLRIMIGYSPRVAR